MKCGNVQELLGGYLYGDLAPHEMKDVRLHLLDCEQCRDDVRTRGLVIDAIPTGVPQLGDEDRQRIMWSVKGAIRARERDERSVLLRVAPAFGLAAVLALGLGIGALISANHTKPRHSERVTRTALSHPKPSAPEAPDTIAPNAQDTPEIAREPVPGFRLPLASGWIGGFSNRRLPATERTHIVPSDTPLFIVPDFGSADGSSEPDTRWKLPKPVDVEDADTIPQPPAQ